MSICLLIQRRYLEVPYKVYIYFPGNILIRIVLMLQVINLFGNSQNSLIQIIINEKFIIYRF